MNNEPWFLINTNNKLYIQQDSPYVELHVANVHIKQKSKQEYYDVRLSESIFEINVEFFYCLDGSLELFMTEKQLWNRFADIIYFVLDSLCMSNFGRIRIAKLGTDNEIMKQDQIVQRWIKCRIG